MPLRRSKKEPKIQLSDGEKLILVMLSEIYKHQKIDGDIDPDFVRSTIDSGQHWGLRWKYRDILGHEESDSKIVQETRNIMDMWWVLENSYAKLSPEQKKMVETGATPLGKVVKFCGFDESEDHLYVARYLLKHFDNYPEFKMRDLNSHMPSIERHRQMLRVFNRVQKSIGANGLSADQIVAVLKAKPSDRP